MLARNICDPRNGVGIGNRAMTAILVERAHSWEAYRKAWMEGMKHLHWFEEQRLFDYNRKEELEDLQRNFGKPDNLFLMARPEGTDRIAGVLRVRLRDGVGVFRGWEPAAPLGERGKGVGEALINEALSLLQNRGIKKAFYMLKYPCDSPETALWHISLYKASGFKQIGPAGVLLIADLTRFRSLPIRTRGFATVGWDNYSLEELTDFVLRAYSSTPEDREIHRWDPQVSNREEILSTLRSAREGKLGSSPPDCRRVALVEGKPAGFIGSFIRKSKYTPHFGVIAPLGVFPEFRRRGIAYSLVMRMHRVLEEHGCDYSLVGTPKTNQRAIRLYRKAGYRPVFEQIHFERKTE